MCNYITLSTPLRGSTCNKILRQSGQQNILLLASAVVATVLASLVAPIYV